MKECFENIRSLNELGFYDLVKDTISTLKSKNQLIPYDFIVIDEAQDIFDRAVQLNISAKTEEAHELFVLFIKHIRWFFEIDKESYDELLELCSPNMNQFLIVNKSYSDLLFDILNEYRLEVGV